MLKLLKRLFNLKTQTYQFSKMDAELLDCEYDGWVFEKVYDHISEILGPSIYPLLSVDKIESAPQSIKNIHYLWLFAAEVGGSGLYDYLVVNYEYTSDDEWLAIHKALTVIGANELMQRFESMVRLGFDLRDIKDYHDPANFSHFKLHKNYKTYDSADEGIYQLINDPFDKFVADYIRNNKEDIFEINLPSG